MEKSIDEDIAVVKEVEIDYLKISSGQRERRKDFVTIEGPLHLIINDEHYVTILSTPLQKKELAIGHLITEGIIKDLNEIIELEIDEHICKITLRNNVKIKERLAFATPFQRVIVSACSTPQEWPLYKLIDRLNVPKVTSKIKVNPKTIIKAARGLSKASVIHAKTGGVHSAAIYKPNGEIVVFSEDVGRHNAVDKAIGGTFVRGYDLKKSFLISTGRITGDIALKAARTGIPIVASLSAAIDSGIEIAKLTGLTLIGFVRANRMNLYTNHNRIL